MYYVRKEREYKGSLAFGLFYLAVIATALMLNYFVI